MELLKFLLFMCLMTGACALETQSHLKISRNGYQLLVVAVHDSVPDNPALFEKIKTTFTKASKVLYTATRNRAYFQKIFFLLPNTWTNRPEYKPSTSVTISGADIIFSAPRSTRRNFSHTRMYAGCGHQGFHTQLLTDIFSNSHPLVQSSPEKFIVHEFAKLRYGVFEEYSSPGENQFYFSTTYGRLDPVRCTVGLRGVIKNGPTFCLFDSIDPDTGEFPPGCTYIPYPFRASGTASMMDHQYVREKIITDSSKVLYSATRHRAYFRKVFFLIPSTWSSGLADKDSTSVNLRDADIIISDPSSVSRRSYPRTRSYAGCGHRGIHIQLRTDVLFNSRHPLVQGKPEKYLIHEFAKYWYGVFEEYPNPGENQFYFSTTFGRADPVRCTTGLLGRIMKRTQSGIQLCSYDSIDPDTGEFPEGCVYYPYPSHNHGTASMMDHSYIQEIKDFCDDDHTPGHFSHNVEPPNRQNRLCSHRSTWDIISNTPDFLNNANPPGSLSDSQLTPQFIVFRAPSRRRRRLAVVLDPPQEFHKRLRLHQAVDHFLTEGFDDDTKVALITNAARMRSRRSAAVKSSLQSIDRFYSLSTMQSRIRRGIEILKKSNSTKEGMEFHLIVISCNNQSGFETEVLQEMATTGITPHFIHCGENGIENMEKIRLQGGHAESRNQRSIFYAVQRLSDKLHDEKDVAVQISNENIELDGDTAYHSEFSLDNSLRGELTIRLHYSASEPSVQVVAPNGSECIYKSTDRKLRYIRLTSLVSHNEQGKWSITIKTPNKESINVLVMLQPIISEDEVPIRTNAWVKVFHEHSPPRVGVYAEVMNGGHPVVNANVTAHVYHEDRKVAVIPLRDSGGGFDIMKNDGIYSNSFTEIESQGRHYVEVMIEDVLTNSEIHRTYEIQLPTEKDTEDDQHALHAPRLDYHTEKIPLRHRLKRSTSSGEFHVDHRWDSLSGGYDYPPARINDLTVTRVNRKDRKVSLSWTATGSDLDNGRASSYEIRYNTNGTALVLNPKKGMLVKENMLGDTSGKPKEAGQVETVTVQFPAKMKWVAIMLKSIDENNNAGEFSNMVTTYFVL